MARITVVGAGYVGLCTAVAFAEHGHHCVLVDVDAGKVASIRAARTPFFEPGLDEALARHVKAGAIEASHELAPAVASSQATFLCVGTPQDKAGAIDLAYIRTAAHQVGQALKGRTEPHVVVTKSTVVPGTTETVVAVEVAKGRGGDLGPVAIANNPEFLKEGAALHDALHPDRIVVGARTKADADLVWPLYSKFTCPKLTVELATAEMIKYAANAFLAVKITTSNEIANLCERVGVDWMKVAEGIGLDARINPLFLRAGIGYGGSCFPKDVAALRAVAKAKASPTPVLDAVTQLNQAQPLRAVDLLRGLVGELKGKRIALLGLAFKPDTDDVRETRALPIHEALTAAGAQVVAYDPKGAENFRRLCPGVRLADSAEDALTGADGAILATEWAEFRKLDPATMRRLMRTPAIVDGRRVLDGAAFMAAGVPYRAIGLGTAAAPTPRPGAN
jgi:UDPglucose 6-dehydrogenase